MRLAGVAPTVSLSRSPGRLAGSKAAVYILDSTAGSRTGRLLRNRPPGGVQSQFLNRLIAERQWNLSRTYQDRLTGEKQARPALENMISDAETERFQIVLFFSFACLADSLRQLVVRLNRLQNTGVGVVSVYERLDSTTFARSEAAVLIASLADFENSVRANKIREGLKRAELLGTESGLPPGRPRVSVDVAEVRGLHERGLSQREIAVQLGVGVGTAHRALKSR